MKTLLFPTLEEALMLHEELIIKFGGKRGIIDRGLLESTLARPKSGYYKSFSEQAAALMQSFALNHCFPDGNKRMAFAMTAIFLKMNGKKIEVKADDAEDFIVNKIIIEKSSLDKITDWIEKNLI